MASPELAQLIETLRALDLFGATDVLEMRAGMDATPPYPVQPDVRWEPVSADGVPCEWNRPDDAVPGRTIVYFHGGGYGIGSIASHRGLCTHLARASRARVLSVDYRLAPEHPHPAAVEDAVKVWRWLLAEGADPARTAFAGDSAGGGLTLASLITLRDAKEAMPAAGLCLSPWVDLTGSNPRIPELAPLDPMLSPQALEVFAQAYVGDGDRRHPTASPLFADLAGLPPLFIQAGRAEILLGEIEALAERARAAGVDVELDLWDDMIHVWQNFADVLPEGRAAIAELGRYAQSRL